MGDLISRSVLIEEFSHNCRGDCGICPHELIQPKGFCGLLKNAPTIDAVPVVRGEWLLKHVGHGHYWECSVCHKNPCIYVTNDTNFCPNCGADMRKKVQNER